LSTKWTIGKIKLPDGYFESLESNGYEIMPMTDAHFSALPLLHRDPFDRMLVAQAQSEDLPLLNADAKISAYDMNVVW
jgi:PIN domain nuclease of toxin-antitoxin system